MPDVRVVGEESADVCDESADGDGQCQSGGQNHQVAGEGTAAHVPGVVYPMEMADPYGYGRPDAIIYHEAGGTDARHDLMGGEGSGTNPTLHHGAQRKRSCLHAHLQSVYAADGACRWFRLWLGSRNDIFYTFRLK